MVSERGLPQLTPVTEGSREGSQTPSVISMTNSVLAEKLLAMMAKLDSRLEKMDSRYEEDAAERKRERQEREAFYSSGQMGSSRSATMADHREGKKPLFTPPERSMPPESFEERYCSVDDAVTEPPKGKTVAPSYSSQISSDTGVSLKANEPMGKEYRPMTESMEKSDLSSPMTQVPPKLVPVPVLDAVGCEKLAGEEEHPISSGDLLTTGMFFSQTGVSQEESGHGKEVGEGNDSNPSALDATAREEESGRMIETRPFQLPLWKPPEMRNKSRLRRIEKSVSVGDAGRCVSRVGWYFERGKFTREKRDQHLVVNGEQMKKQGMEKYATDPVKIYGRDFIALTTIPPEIAKKLWEKAFMIGIKVKMRIGVKGFELNKLMIVAKMERDWSETAATPSEIDKGGVGDRLGQNKYMGQLSQTDPRDGPQLFNNRPKVLFLSERQTTSENQIRRMKDEEEIRPHASPTGSGESDPSSSPPARRITVTAASAGLPSYSLTPPASLSHHKDPDALALALLPIQTSGGAGGSNGRSSGDSGMEDCWSEKATAVLIDDWGERYLELSRGNLKQKHWKGVAEIVCCREDYGKTPKTDIQRKNKFDTVKKKYKQEKGRIANGGGRMYVTFDRCENDWEVVKRGWDAQVLGEAPQKFKNAVETVKTLRKEPGANDQHLLPFVIVDDAGKAVGPIVGGDAVITFRFRADRMDTISLKSIGEALGQREQGPMVGNRSSQYIVKGFSKADGNENSFNGTTHQIAMDTFLLHECDGTQNERGWCQRKLSVCVILAVLLDVCRGGNKLPMIVLGNGRASVARGSLPLTLRARSNLKGRVLIGWLMGRNNYIPISKEA